MSLEIACGVVDVCVVFRVAACVLTKGYPGICSKEHHFISTTQDPVKLFVFVCVFSQPY